jgi:hypothetical protein
MSKSPSENEYKKLDVINHDNLISAKEAAKLFGCSQDYIGQFCRGGHVKCIKEGRTWMVDKNSLLEYKEKKEAEKIQAAEELSKKRHEEYLKKIDENAHSESTKISDLVMQVAILPALMLSLFFMNGMNVLTEPFAMTKNKAVETSDYVVEVSKNNFDKATKFANSKFQLAKTQTAQVSEASMQMASILNPLDFLDAGYGRYEKFTNNIFDKYTDGIYFVGEKIADLGLYKFYIDGVDPVTQLAITGDDQIDEMEDRGDPKRHPRICRRKSKRLPNFARTSYFGS